MEIKTFTLDLDDVDLKGYVDFKQILLNPSPGSIVDFIHQAVLGILDQLIQRGMLPITISGIADLVFAYCESNDVSVNFRFVREVVKSSIEGRTDVVINSESERKSFVILRE